MRALLRSAAVASVLAACATPHTPKDGHPVLADVGFTGNANLTGDEITARIYTEPTRGLFVKTPGYWDPDVFDIDKRRILRLYESRGFYEARITGVDVNTDDKGRVKVLVHLDEGRRVTVRARNIKGLEAVPADLRAEDEEALTLEPGKDFTWDDWTKTKDELAASLREHGYAEATVTGDAVVDPASAGATLNIQAKPGPRLKIGRVIVAGAQQVSRVRISNVAAVKPGDWYSTSAIDRTQQRVYNLGAFAGVRVNRGAASRADGTVPIVISVREAPFHTVKAGGGFALTLGRVEIPELRLDYTNRNTFGGLQRLEAGASGGYAWLPSIFGATDQGPVANLYSQLVFPDVGLRDFDLVTRAEAQYERQQGFSYGRAALRVSLPWRLPRNTLTPSVNFERYGNVQLHLGGADPNNIPLTPQFAFLNSCKGGTLFSGGCTITYLGQRWVFDQRDSALAAHKGVFLSLDLQEGGPPGNFTFVRVLPEARGYVPVGHFVVAARAEVGGLLPISSPGAGPDGAVSPIVQRFFSGGQLGMRAFGEQGLGPKILLLTSPTNADGTPRSPLDGAHFIPAGGNGLFEGSVELRWYFGQQYSAHLPAWMEDLGAVLFVDAGDLELDLSKVRLAAMETAIGLGLRYNTPFGALRFDLGYRATPHPLAPIAVINADGTSGSAGTYTIGPSCAPNDQTCFSDSLSLFGLSLGRFAPHLSLGEAF